MRFQFCFEAVEGLSMANGVRQLIPGNWTYVGKAALTHGLLVAAWDTENSSVSGGTEGPGRSVHMKKFRQIGRGSASKD